MRWHYILILIAVYLLGVYFPQVGKMTAGRLIPVTR